MNTTREYDPLPKGWRDGDAEDMVGGPVGPRKKNCDLAQTGAIFRQEGSGSPSILL